MARGGRPMIIPSATAATHGFNVPLGNIDAVLNG